MFISSWLHQSAVFEEKMQPPLEKDTERNGVGREFRFQIGQKEKELIFIDHLLCSKHLYELVFTTALL